MRKTGSPTKKSQQEEEVTLTQEEQEEALKELFAASDKVEEGVEEIVSSLQLLASRLLPELD